MYTQLEQKELKRKVDQYEKIIKQINDYYMNYRVSYTKPNNYDSQILYCLKKGREGLAYYLPDYLNTGFISDEEKHLFQQVERFSLVENKLNKKEVLLNMLITNNFSVDDIENLDINAKIKFLIKHLSSSQISRTSQAILLLISNDLIPEYHNIFNSIKQRLDKELEKEKNVTKALTKILDTNQITIDPVKALNALNNHYRNHQAYRVKLIEEMQQNFDTLMTKQTFIENSNRLKNEIQSKIASGMDKEEVLSMLLPQAYALAKAACEFAIGKTQYDVQLMGAIAINEGNVAEMYTGEGKTLTAILPAYLNALTGSEVDIFTPNDYLAERDAKNNAKIFELLGLKVGCVKVEGQSILEKKKAYQCDIVYGSATAFAFDFLYDTNASSSENVVQRVEKPGLVIVDEADQILINNALSPYQLSSNGLPLTISEQKENEEAKKYLYKALEIEKKLSKSMYRAKNLYDFECVTGDNKEATARFNQEYSLLVFHEPTSSQGQVVLTEKGETELFYYVMKEEIDSLSTNAKEYFEAHVEYQYGEDYTLENEKLLLTIKGLEKAIKNTKEFSQLNLKWLSEERYQVIRKYVVNALNARYLMENGRNYVVGYNAQKQRHEVYVLQDGRIMANSKFTDGLHQAIELKEGLEIVLDKNERLIDRTLATVSNRALLSRYDKISGMTGTADKTAFYEIYKMDTFEVPRHKEYLYYKNPDKYPQPTFRDDQPTRLYRTKEDKIFAIINDIVESHRSGQPILVVADSGEDAEMLYELVSKINGMSPSLLIAGKNLEEENKIIAEAGQLNAVTIATEMAGRGTDIRLGGEEDTFRRKLFEKTVADNSYITFSPEELAAKVDEFEKKYQTDEEYRGIVDAIVREEYDRIVSDISELGGLKYIQMNPFKTSRNDNQGRGRVGRQGEPGSTVMYASIEELPSLGVDRDNLKKLDNLMGDNPVLIDDQVGGMISNIIEEAQNINEFNMDRQIASTDAMDLAMSSIGMMLLKNRKKLLATEDVNVVVDNMVYSVVEQLIKDSVPLKKQKKIDKNNTKLKNLDLNLHGLSAGMIDIFGIDLMGEKALKDCKDVADLKYFMFELADKKRKDLERGFDKTKTNSNYKRILVDNINQVYNNFLYSSQAVSLQIMNDSLAQNQSHDRTLQISLIYDECKIDGWKSCMKKIFKPGIKEKKESETQTWDVDPVIAEESSKLEPIVKPSHK